MINFIKTHYLKIVTGAGLVYTSILSINKFFLAYGYLNTLTISDECIKAIYYDLESVSISWYYGLILDLFKWSGIWAIVSFILLFLFLKEIKKKVKNGKRIKQD